MHRNTIYLIIFLLTISQICFAGGVAFVTHGFTTDGVDTMDWLNDASGKLVERIGDNSNVSLYTLTLLDTGLSLTCRNGVTFGGQSNTTGHAVVIIDWTRYSVDVGGIASISTVQIAEWTVDYLLAQYPEFLASPLHFIGHSRGGSMIGAMAERLGYYGYWIDQLTFLDPHPTENDILEDDWGEEGMVVPSNVIFADNYYREGLGGPDGEVVTGAYNIRFDNLYLNRGYIGVANTHSDVHAWYRGTIPQDPPPYSLEPDAGFTVTSDWYDTGVFYNPSEARSRDNIGYAFSLATNNGTNRPSSGLHSGINGTGVTRSFLPIYYDPIDNAGYLVISTMSIAAGEMFVADYCYESWRSNFGVEFFLDNNRNPYDGYDSSLGAVSHGISGGFKSTLMSSVVPATLTVPSDQEIGTYYVLVKTTGSNDARYFYAPSRLTIGTPQNAPVLSNPRVSPMSGTEFETNFEFMVDYYDADGDVPGDYKDIHLSDGRVVPMSLKSGDPSNGTYHYITNWLSSENSPYIYRFFFSDIGGLSDMTQGQIGPYVYTSDSTIEINTEVDGGPVTNNIEIRFGYGPDLQNLEYFEWMAPGLPQYVGIDSGQQVVFAVNLESANHTFVRWEYKNDQGEVIRERTNESDIFTLLSGNLHATAYLNYTPLTYTISGTVLRSDGAVIPGGVDLTLASSEQNISQHTDNGNFTFSGVKGGVPVSVTPVASGYSFAPPNLFYGNLEQDQFNQTLTGDSSDDLVPTTSFLNTPPAVSEISNISFTWTGQDNVTAAENLQYQYKLAGYDSDWSALSNTTSENYDLANGVYTFQIRAIDEAGNINQTPTSYLFTINAAPRVAVTNRNNNSVWASRITLNMPLGSTNPTQTFILLLEHSAISDPELVPVAIHQIDSNVPIGGNESFSAELDIPAIITKAEAGWLVTLPQPIAQGQSVQYDIIWGKIKYFGWNETVQVPQGFPNLITGGDYSGDGKDGAFLDDQLRMWRQAHKNRRRIDGVWGSRKAWGYMDIADKNGSIHDEQLLDYIPGIPDNGSYACDYTAENGRIVKLSNNICYIWITDKYEKIGGSTYDDYSYHRYSLALFDATGNLINSYEDNWQENTSIDTPTISVANGLYLTGVTTNYGTNTMDMWFVRHDYQGQISQNRTVFESFSRTNSGYLDCYGVRPCGDNVLFVFDRYYSSSGGDRQEICYQVRDAVGNIVKPTTIINPPLLSDSIEKDDEYYIETVLTDNAGKVWVSFSHYRSGQPYENYYVIIGSDGNIWKANTFLGNEIWRNFRYCDKDGYIWATENSNLLILNNDDTFAFPARAATYFPNQSVGQIAAARDYFGGANYRLYDRWSPQTIQVDVPAYGLPDSIKLYNLNLWDNNLHPSDINLKKGETTIWSQSGQFVGEATIDVSGVLNEGPNLLIMTQNDFMGG